MCSRCWVLRRDMMIHLAFEELRERELGIFKGPSHETANDVRASPGHRLSEIASQEFGWETERYACTDTALAATESKEGR